MAKRGGLISLMAFIAFLFVGFAYMLFIAIGSSNVGNAFMLIGTIVAMIIVGIISFFYAFANRKGRVWFIVAWVVACVFIVLALIFGTANIGRWG